MGAGSPPIPAGLTPVAERGLDQGQSSDRGGVGDAFALLELND